MNKKSFKFNIYSLFTIFQYLLVLFNGCNLPINQCELFYDISYYSNSLKCPFNVELELIYANRIKYKCKELDDQPLTFVHFFPTSSFSNYVLEERFFRSKQLAFFSKISWFIWFKFHGVDRIRANNDVDDKELMALFKLKYFSITFLKSRIGFDYGDDSQKFIPSSCSLESTGNTIETTTTRFMFNYLYIDSLKFIKCEYREKICPIVFQNSNINSFDLNFMVKSYLKTNSLSFFKANNMDIEVINSNIQSLSIFFAENIDLDSNLLNEAVFVKIKFLTVFSNLNLIEETVFKSFNFLKTICFMTRFQQELFHKNGIKWIKYLNSDVNITMNDNLFKELDQ